MKKSILPLSTMKDVYFEFDLESQSYIEVSHCGTTMENTQFFLERISGGRLLLNHATDNPYADRDCSTPYLKTRLQAGSYRVISEGIYKNGSINTNIKSSIRLPETDYIHIGNFNGSFNYTANFNTRMSSQDVSYEACHYFVLNNATEINLNHCGSEMDETYMIIINQARDTIYERVFSQNTNPSCTEFLRCSFEPGTYYIFSSGIEKDGNMKLNISYDIPVSEEFITGSDDQNYIIRKAAREKVSDRDNLTTANSNTVIEYYDGLGRLSNTVQNRFSPKGVDIVNYNEYDAYGKKVREWLPAVSVSSNGEYATLSEVSSMANNFYNDIPYHDYIYEPSPLNRLTGEMKPGDAWKNHPSLISYGVGTKDEVIYYMCKEDGTIVCNTDWNNMQTSKTTYKDEDGKISYRIQRHHNKPVNSYQTN